MTCDPFLDDEDPWPFPKLPDDMPSFPGWLAAGYLFGMAAAGVLAGAAVFHIVDRVRRFT